MCMGLEYFVHWMNDYEKPFLCCRHTLAIMHFNENVHREKQRTEYGKIFYTVQYQQHKCGDKIMQEVAVSPTQGTLDFLFLTM